MEKRIHRAFVLTALTVLLAVSFLFALVLYAALIGQAEEKLDLEMRLAVTALDEAADAPAYFDRASGLDERSRYTWVSPEGVVLYDSQANPAHMENHLGRDEIAEAMKSGAGRATRVSATQGTLTVYLAQRLWDGSVLRLSSTYRMIWASVLQSLAVLSLIALAIMLFSALHARRITRRIVGPINAIDPGAPMQSGAYEELAPLLTRLKSQNETIAAQMDALSLRQREFDAVTENMAEGLIILDASGIVLSINKSALALLNATDRQCVGQHISMVNRSPALRDALKRGAADEVIRLGERVFRVMASGVESPANKAGTIALIWEITQSYNAEAMRKEFTANVSHELKTPLTSISGYAELIESGMARSEDVAAFSRRILEESRRMLALIDDIIALSRLDEQRVSEQWQPVDLQQVAHAVKARLASSAAEHGIAIEVAGEPAWIDGLGHLLDQMVFNLTDNAIRYGRDGGHVCIRTGAKDGHAFLSVEDDGVGIPAKYHDKVFERFFRVDKDRSRETGGTGLGLSIVRHGAQIHGAAISMHSQVHAGTTIAIKFKQAARGE